MDTPPPVVTPASKTGATLYALFCSSLVALLWLCWGQPAMAKNAFALESNEVAIKQHLTKHGHKIKEIYVDDRKDWQIGAYRSLYVKGDLTPQNLEASAKSDGAAKKARVAARAFLKEQAELYGLTPQSDMREAPESPAGVVDDMGHTHLPYKHYINGLAVLGSGALFHVSPESKITHIDVSIVPITPELIEAVNKPTLDEAAIRAVIQKDLNAPSSEIRYYFSAEKLALPVAPYVTYTVSANAGKGTFDYSINAFTGEIIWKRGAISYE